MKRTIVALALIGLVLSATSVLGQDYKQALRYEIKGGVTSSFLISNDYRETGLGWGWTGGVGLHLPFFSKHLGLQIEAMYTAEEAQLRLNEESTAVLNLPGPAQNGEYSAAFDNIEIPIMLQIGFFDADDFRAYAFGGVVNSFRQDTEVTYTNADTGERVTENLEAAKDHDVGPIFGAGLRFASFLVELRMNLGLKSLGGDNTAIDTKVGKSAFMFGFSF